MKYITSYKAAIKCHYLIHELRRMLKDAAEVALCIENNAGLLRAGAALADARLGRPQADHSRSSLPKKREASPLQDNCVWSSNQSR